MTCAPSRHRATTTSVPSCACVRPHMRLCTHARPNRACTRYSLFTKAPVRWVVSSSKDAGIGTPELTAAAWKVALVDSMAARLSWRSCSSAGLVSPAARGMDCKQVDIAGRVLGRGRAFAVDGPRGRGGGWEEGRKGRLPLCREGKRRARCDKKRRLDRQDRAMKLCAVTRRPVARLAGKASPVRHGNNIGLDDVNAAGGQPRRLRRLR